MLSIVIRAITGGVFLGLGVVGLLFPAATRAFISRFLEKAPVRILGIVLMALGAAIFRVAGGLYLPVAGHVVGVVLFMAGGIHILIPDFAIVLNEWWVMRKTIWERLISLIYLLVAVLLFMPQEGVSWPERPQRRVPGEYRRMPEPPPAEQQPEPSANDAHTPGGANDET